MTDGNQINQQDGLNWEQLENIQLDKVELGCMILRDDRESVCATRRSHLSNVVRQVSGGQLGF